MGDNNQTQFKTEGQPAFPVENKENDNSSDSSTGKETNIDQTGSSDQDNKGTENKNGDENLADHPRWKEREDDWKGRFNDQEKRHGEELTKLREEVEGRFKQFSGSNQNAGQVQVPAWFGGDEQAWKEYTAWHQTELGKAREEAVKEFKSKSESEQKSIEEATKYFNDEVNTIEADKALNPDGLKVDRNKLLKVALDNELVDTKGRWNYKAAFKMMSAKEVFQAKAALNEKREVANATNSENRAESKPQAYATSDTFKKPGERPW